MGRPDITMNECLQDATRYTDCFNTALGTTLVDPNTLIPIDRIEEGNVSFPRTMAHYKKERDGIRGVRTESDILCAVVCVENQKDIHYAQAARHMIYDAFNYNRQLTDIRKRHEKNQNRTYQGFAPDDHLIPVITVCIYYGEDPWNAPTQLVDLMDFSAFSKRNAALWKKYIQNYHITVLDIRRMSDEQIEQMTYDLKLLFGMLKYDNDQTALQSFIHQHESDINKLSGDLAEAFTLYSKTKELTKHIKTYQTEGGESVNMCKAIDDMVKDGEARGEARGKHNIIIELLRDNIISLSEAAKRLNLSEAALLEQLK